MNSLPQNTLVKVTFRCDEINKLEMLNSDCIIHISVGQEYHEGEKLIATMDLINETFKSCTIMLCDTLQRHTLRLDYPNASEGDLRAKALLLGDEWLERNHHAYDYLTIKKKIMRWDEWLQNPQYNKYYKEIEERYQADCNYQAEIHKTINKFLKRRGMLDNKEAFKICETYVLEECPILVPLWAQTGIKYIIYPRFRTSAMNATYNHYIAHNKEKILREVALKFNKRSVPKKLSFSYSEVV